jgi:hypothetical protein
LAEPLLRLEAVEKEERRTLSDRRRFAHNGRRAGDLQPAGCICIETRQEMAKLKSVIQLLADAVQTLTADHHKP